MSKFQDGSMLVTPRLKLAPLQASDADAMVSVLDDEKLHEFIGGRPCGIDALRLRYQELVEGSGSDNQLWLNWIVRRAEDETPVGTVQATLTRATSGWIAEIAWVIGVQWQRRGYATESARSLVQWLADRGVAVVTANINPEHQASAKVATRAGFIPTAAEVDGECVWRLSHS